MRVTRPFLQRPARRTNRCSTPRTLAAWSLGAMLSAATLLGTAIAQTPAPQQFDTYVGDRPEAVLLHRIERGQTIQRILELIYAEGGAPTPAEVLARNPQSFVNGDLNRPIAGTTLSLPLGPEPSYGTRSAYNAPTPEDTFQQSAQRGSAVSPPNGLVTPMPAQTGTVAAPAVTAVAPRAPTEPTAPRTPVVGAVELLSGALVGQDIDGNRRILSEGDAVHGGDRLILRTGRGKVRLLDGSQIFLRDQSDIVIQQLQFENDDLNRGRRVVSLAKGGLRMISGLLHKNPNDSNKPDIRTPVAVIGVRGTETSLHFCAEETCVTERGELPRGLATGLASGEISLGNSAGAAVLAPEDVYKVRDAVTAPEPAPELACIMLGINCEPEAPVCHERLSAKGIGAPRRYCRDFDPSAETAASGG